MSTVGQTSFRVNPARMRLAGPPQQPQTSRIDAPDRDFGDLFLDALEVVVLAALERIGNDPAARLRFFQRLLAAAEEEAGGRYLS